MMPLHKSKEVVSVLSSEIISCQIAAVVQTIKSFLYRIDKQSMKLGILL